MDRKPGGYEHDVKLNEPLCDPKTAIHRLWFACGKLWVEFCDERIIGVPLTWFPRLMNASEEDRNNYEFSQRGIHWNSLDEDISVEGLLNGCGDVTRRPHGAA